MPQYFAQLRSRLAANSTQRPTLLLGALLLSFLALALGFQPPAGLSLDLGGALRRLPGGNVGTISYDEPYLADSFHAAEPAQVDATTSKTFRWSLPDSAVEVPALGPGPWLVTLTVNAGRVDGTAAELRLAADEPLLQTAIPSGAWRTIRVVVPGGSNGDARFTLHTSPYRPSGDERPKGPLGIVVDQLTFQQQGWHPWLPATTWLLLAGALLVLALGSLLAGLRAELVAVGVLVLGAVGALALIQWRTALTLLAPTLFSTALAALLLMLLLGAIGTAAARRGAVSSHDIWPVAGLIALGFLIRLSGMRHPHQLDSDVGMNFNNLQILSWQGIVIQTERLPCEAGLQPAPYPPGFYILLTPFLLLWRDTRLVVEAAAALGDALVIGAIWAVMRLYGATQRAALMAGAFYLTAPAMLASLAVGELANVAGQFMAMSVVALSLPLLNRGHPMRDSIVLALLVTAGFLGHLGVAASLGLLLACWAGLLLLNGQRQAGLRLLLAILGAGLLAALVYYSVFYNSPLLEAEPTPGCPPQLALGQKLYYHGYEVVKLWSLSPPIILAAGLAGALLARRGTPRLALLLLAWWAAALLSLSTLLFSTQTLRWQHFLYPALAAGAGLLASLLWQRRGALRILAALLVAYSLLHGISFWIYHIATYKH